MFSDILLYFLLLYYISSVPPGNPYFTTCSASCPVICLNQPFFCLNKHFRQPWLAFTSESALNISGVDTVKIMISGVFVQSFARNAQKQQELAGSCLTGKRSPVWAGIPSPSAAFS